MSNLAGTTWIFKETLTLTTCSCQISDLDENMFVRVGYSSGGYKINVTSSGMTFLPSTTATYSSSTGWKSDSFRYIEFLVEPDTFTPNEATFMTWLKLNAKQIREQPSQYYITNNVELGEIADAIRNSKKLSDEKLVFPEAFQQAINLTDLPTEVIKSYSQSLSIRYTTTSGKQTYYALKSLSTSCSLTYAPVNNLIHVISYSNSFHAVTCGLAQFDSLTNSYYTTITAMRYVTSGGYYYSSYYSCLLGYNIKVSLNYASTFDGFKFNRTLNNLQLQGSGTIPSAINIHLQCLPLSTLELNSHITGICDEAFKDNSNLQLLTGTTNINTILSSAFNNCQNLQEANFPNCTLIGSNAFQFCSSLSEISFPICTMISSRAFESCNNLLEANFPLCNTIDSCAFRYCSSLKMANFPVCTTISNGAFCGCYFLSEINFPSCTVVSSYGFQYCSSLKSAIFPECSIIAWYGFQSCTQLSIASFPKCTTIDLWAFYDNQQLQTISFPQCSSIGSYAFYNCINLTSIDFPNCSYVSSSAFDTCTELTSISFPKCRVLYSAAFNKCYKLISANFPLCTQLYGQVFGGCSNLTTAIFPACTSISGWAFAGCDKLSSISFPVCTTVGESAFYSCSALQTISFPACTYISTGAFWGCSNLVSAYFLGSSYITLASYFAFADTPLYSSAFGYYASLYFRESMLASYKTRTNWSRFSDRMVGLTDAQIEALS